MRRPTSGPGPPKLTDCRGEVDNIENMKAMFAPATAGDVCTPVLVLTASNRSGSGADTRLQQPATGVHSNGHAAQTAGDSGPHHEPPPPPPAQQLPERQSRGGQPPRERGSRPSVDLLPNARTASNRRSAARSRMRKIQHVHELEQRVEEMSNELQVRRACAGAGRG